MKLVIFVIGLLVGALLALGMIEQFAVYTPLEVQTETLQPLQSTSLDVCNPGLQPVNYTCEGSL